MFSEAVLNFIYEVATFALLFIPFGGYTLLYIHLYKTDQGKKPLLIFTIILNIFLFAALQVMIMTSFEQVNIWQAWATALITNTVFVSVLYFLYPRFYKSYKDAESKTKKQ
jgi:hypothetical protein